MRRFLPSLPTFALLCVAAGLSSGCEIIAHADRDKIPNTGGSSSTETGGGGVGAEGGGAAGGAGGEGGGMVCMTAAECGTDSECRTFACEDGFCVTNDLPDTTTCGTAGSLCKTQDTCDGAGTCVDNGFKPATVACRPEAGPCDVTELCTGTSADCPADAKSTAECRAAVGTCDVAEVCNGTDDSCPADVLAVSNTVCRAGSGDACDPDERCNGAVGTCPLDVFEPSSTSCRGGSGDLCDPDEFCPGTAGGACPANTNVEPVSTSCRAGSGDLCDPDEFCPGTVGGTCPPDTNVQPDTTTCRVGTGDPCDPAELCTGNAGEACPNDFVYSDNTPCDDGEACTNICDGGVCTDAAAADCEVLWCFEDGADSFITTTTIGTGTFAYGSATTSQSNGNGSFVDQPAACLGETTGNEGARAANWMEASYAAAAATGDCFTFTLDTGADPLVLRFDEERTPTGPTLWGLEYDTASISPTELVSGVSTTSNFTSHPMQVIDLSGLGLDNQTGAVIRLCGYAASNGSGTWKVDNFHVFTGGCFDGIQNGAETGVDTGSNCPVAP